jgi:hypothetical protein
MWKRDDEQTMGESEERCGKAKAQKLTQAGGNEAIKAWVS